MGNGKYKELYQLALDIYKGELDRYKRLEDKASKYFASLTFVVGIYLMFSKWILEKALPPITIVEWLLVIIAFLCLISLLLSWAMILYVLRIQGLKKLPLTDETISLFTDESLVTAYYTMVRGIRDANKINREITNRKAKWLNHGYITLMVTVLLMFFLLGLSSLHIAREDREKDYPRNHQMNL